MAHDDYRTLRDAYRAKAASDPPAPWRLLRTPHIGAITGLGFGPGTELLLVMSHSGVGVIDCTSGEKVARAYEDPDHDDGPYPISCPGIGPLAGQLIAIEGLWGGGLRRSAPDGWSVSRVAPDWPTECVVLHPPESDDFWDVEAAVMLVKDADPMRALGFSDSGQSLAAANSGRLWVWTRPTPVGPSQ